MVETVFDTEGDGLLDTITKFHCLCWKTADAEGTITDPEEMAEWFQDESRIYICHNAIDFDRRAVKEILKVDIKGKIIDTLPLAWYLHPGRPKYGLESYGEDYGIPKPKVLDWQNEPLEVYINRCTEDVKINWRLWLDLKAKLQELYS